MLFSGKKLKINNFFRQKKNLGTVPTLTDWDPMLSSIAKLDVQRNSQYFLKDLSLQTMSRPSVSIIFSLISESQLHITFRFFFFQCHVQEQEKKRFKSDQPSHLSRLVVSELLIMTIPLWDVNWPRTDLWMRHLHVTIRGGA